MLAIENEQVGYTMRQASMLVPCHPKRIYQIVKDGNLQTYAGVDGRMMVSREELYHYLRNKGT
jgi:hypothetical protein